MIKRYLFKGVKLRLINFMQSKENELENGLLDIYGLNISSLKYRNKTEKNFYTFLTIFFRTVFKKPLMLLFSNEISILFI